MVTSNYHIHSTYCDGKNTLEEMVQAAIASGLTDIGFSGHAPLPYDNDWTIKEDEIESYINEVNSLKKKYQSKITISLGLEVDYFIETEDIAPLSKKLIPRLDFFIGSVHSIGRTKSGKVADIDYTPKVFEEGICDCFSGSVKHFVQAYFKAIGKMAKQIKPDIIGHIDLIKKNNENNRFYNENEPWYHQAVMDCLKEIKTSGCIIEANTGGMIRYGDRCLYPSFWMMQAINTLNIPITLNGDSHSTAGIAYAYKATTEQLQTAGFQAIMVMKNKKWTVEGL